MHKRRGQDATPQNKTAVRLSFQMQKSPCHVAYKSNDDLIGVVFSFVSQKS